MFTLKTQGVFERFQGEHFISSILLGMVLFRVVNLEECYMYSQAGRRGA